MSAAIDHLYHYAGVSTLDEGASALSLVTSGGPAKQPYFFEGRLLAPRVTALCLRALTQIVGARFFVPPAMLARILREADPVITCGRGRLRFEGFSGCASTYVRVDITEAGFAGETVGMGTTNVDFNAKMRAALAGVRDGEELSLSVGKRAVSMRSEGAEVIERKVPLPVRWLKGFVEVQAYLARMRLFHELPRTDAMRFLRGLPRMKTSKHGVFLVPQGASLRTSMTKTSGALRTTGLERLRVLEDLAAHALCLRVYGDEDASGQSSAWELDFGSVRLTLALSAEVWRGFSGEGRALLSLAKKDSVGELAARLAASLHWEPRLDPAVLAAALGAEPAEIRRALEVLGSRGIVGFDQHEGSYFHRQLPYDLERLGELSPRLDGARELLAARAVTAGGTAGTFRVQSEDVEHRVEMPSGDDETAARCSCVWFAKHQSTRGPCKHVLAVVLQQESGEEGSRG